MALFRESLELLTAVPTSEGWQVGHATAELLRLADSTADGAEVALLSLPEVTALLTEAFRGRPGRSNFRTGTLTMCTMHPMRSIPHRVVCLLGLDDGVFPRRRRIDGDDVTAVVERIGDADPRSEDRQLLLDALLAAEEHLVVVYAGMDARTGGDIPPAVPVKELLDTLDLTARTADGSAVSAAVTTRHRLQPYDPANFSGFSFDRGSTPRRPGGGVAADAAGAGLRPGRPAAAARRRAGGSGRADPVLPAPGTGSPAQPRQPLLLHRRRAAGGRRSPSTSTASTAGRSAKGCWR